jgi:general secretion pathway protein G
VIWTSVAIAALTFLAFFFVIIPSEKGDRDRELRAAVKRHIDLLTKSLKAYAADHDGRFPTRKQGLKALYVKPEDDAAWKGPYVTSPRALQDPFGTPLEYDHPEDDGETAIPSVWSRGRDKSPDTSDDIR